MVNTSPRTLALNILNKIESRDAYADILLEDAFARHPLKDVDKGLLRELGVFRGRLTQFQMFWSNVPSLDTPIHPPLL